jgi:glutamine synthetase
VPAGDDMRTAHIDYLWVDGFDTPTIRSKTKIQPLKNTDDESFELEIEPWNFDGSSTGQATTTDSERILLPARLYQVTPSHYFLLCEVCNGDETPHKTNYREELRTFLEENPQKNMWVGFEQEYFLTDQNKNIFWPTGGGEPINDPRYYCSVGGDRVKKRNLVRSHATGCWDIGIQIAGYNAEVAPGQWEFQCFAEDALRACDDLWVARYMMSLLSEAESLGIDWSPKPHDGWNGSGCHTNFSTIEMRDEGGETLFNEILEKMEQLHSTTIKNYGTGNDLRLLGAYETSNYSKFTYGVGSRDTSVRVPNSVPKNEWKGYLEDRRPSSNCDPYRVVFELLKFV